MSAIVGRKFVLTGFRSKKLETYIADQGGSVMSAVSFKTDYVVAKDVSNYTGKVNKAEKLNIPVISRLDLFDLLFDVK